MIDIFGFKINDKILYTALTLAIGYLIYRALLGIVNKSFALRMKREKIDQRRQKTMNIIINNILKYAFSVIVLFAVLGVLGVNAGAIIASIGVVGLAIGLAVQDILKDTLAGIFILIENQYAVGDIVTIGSFKGEVTFLGLKSTKLRSDTGEIKILSNRNIAEITNYSLSNATSFIDIELAYDNDEKVIDEMFTSLVTRLSKNVKNIKASFKYAGIQMVGAKVTYRLSVESDIRYQDDIRREAWREIKTALDANGIRR